jgi:hypothetical protein
VRGMGLAAPEWRRLLGAAALGALIAFPAGLLFSGRGSVQPEARRSSAAPPSEQAPQKAGRNPFSPIVLDDPYVEAQHRRAVEAMELSCLRTGQLCAEAQQARQYLRRRDADGGR